MGLVTVVVRLKDTTPSLNPVVGATVRFYDSGDVFITQETTDVNGMVDVILNGSASPGTNYHVRAYKPGCSFGGPWQIDVLDPPGAHPLDNDWTMPVNVFEVPNSPVPGMCRVAGYLVRPDNTPLYPGSVRFSLHKVPYVFSGALVGDHAVAYTDANGYAQIDLIRGAEYEAVVSHQLEESRKVVVPDRGGVLLGDLVYPIPISVDWGVTSPISLAVGASVNLNVAVLGTDYNNWKTGGDYMLWSSDNPLICTLAPGTDYLVLRAVSAGFTTLRGARSTKIFRTKPDRALLGATLDVIVT